MMPAVDNFCEGLPVLDMSGFYHEQRVNKLIIKPDMSPLVK